MFLLPNPWLILAGVLIVGSAYLSGDLVGAKRGADAVQVKWDKESAQRALRNAENVTRAQDTQDKLQGAADADRKKNAEVVADLNTRLDAANRELSNRLSRPGPGADPKTAGAGASRQCTGTGLYRDDALFLTRLADSAQRIRLQRDTCYDQYERAQAALERLSAQGAGNVLPSPSSASSAP